MYNSNLIDALYFFFLVNLATLVIREIVTAKPQARELLINYKGHGSSFCLPVVLTALQWALRNTGSVLP